MAIINDALYWLSSTPPFYWLVDQPLGFTFFVMLVAVVLGMGLRGMRGPEI